MFLLPSSHWEVRGTKHKGKGVFAKKDIEAGTVIGDYIGKVIHPKDEQRFEKKLGFYSMYYHNNATIFPDIKKDGIHVINHSCTPNCWMSTYRGHTLYFSIRKIFKGEELTISYLLGPQDDSCKPCDHQCKCESTVCSQTMHTAQKKFDAWCRHDDKKSMQTKSEPVKMGKTLPMLSSYPKTILDHALYTLFGAQYKKAAVYKDTTPPHRKELRKRIRKTGRRIYFKNLGTTVIGISDGVIFSKSL